MANSKHKFITKLKVLFFSCCAIVLSLTVAVNFILAKNKNRIIQTLNNHFFKPVNIDNIIYLPPNIIILRNFGISQDEATFDKKLLNITLSYTSFSLSDLLLKRTLRVSSLNCVGLIINSSDLFSLVKDNFTQLLDFITGLPKQDFRLSFQQVGFGPAKNNLYPREAKGSLNLELKKEVLSASGSAGKNTFSFKGLLSKGQIKVENFKLSNNDIDCQFWGKLSSSLAEFKGFIFANNPNSAKKPSPPKLLILDIDLRVKLAFPHVEIERLNFSVNNNPVKLTADMLLAEPFTCNLKLSSDFRNMDSKNDVGLKKISLVASAVSTQVKTIKINAGLNIDFSEYKKNYLPLEKLSVNAKDLVLSFKEPRVLKISSSTLNLFSKTRTGLYDINLEDLNIKVYQLDQALKPVKFSSLFYGGRLQGRASIKMQDFLPVISAMIRVKGVDANKLEGILIYFSKVYGKLSSQMLFTNYPQLTFKGTLHIHDGYLGNFEFLKWLAKLFDLASLKKIGFNTVSSDFIVNKEGAGMYNMDLNSENVKIKGGFKLKEADMVSSTISLSLRRKLLQESSKLNALLRLLGTKQDLIKFNFALSGNLHNMNFQWLKSDFKDELTKAIPNFVKRRLEKKLEDIIESIGEE